MTTTAPTKWDAQVERAAKARQDARAAIDAVRADTHLSVEGRTVQVRDIITQANATIDDAQVKYDEAKTVEVERAKRRVFTSFSIDTVTLRDAAMRAQETATEDEALRMFTTAERQGDKSLMRELAAVAIDRSWAELANAFQKAEPIYADDYEIIWDAAHDTSAIDVKHAMLIGMAFAHVTA
ncbi:hypothetical protein [Demequina sp.]|uniref:hypothetical protein n=1 Tax=Demequina sp. TaxID=2050685 RepID=UPI003D0D8AF5